MRKTLIRSTLLALIISLFTIVPVLAYTYSAYITVTESSGNAYTQFPFTVFMDNSYLDTQGYITNDGLDVDVSVNGSSVPRMVVSDRTLFVSDLAANHTITPLLTTGNTPASSMEIIVGNGGEIETPDDATLEPTTNGFIFSTNGYIDTSLGASKYILYKDSALSVQNDAAGRITADFSGSTTNIAGIASGEHEISVGTISPKLSGDYIRVDDDPVLEFGANDLTVNMWVNFNTMPDDGYLYAHGGGVGSDRFYLRFFNPPTNTLQWVIGTAPALNLTVPFTPVLDTWYNIILRRSVNDFEIYIDGVLAGTDNVVYSIGELLSYNYFGASVTGGDSEYFGQYQDIRILTRAITAGEIAAYQTCTYTDDTDLQLFLRCIDEPGSTVIDSSVNDIPATIITIRADTWDRGGLYNFLMVDDDISIIIPPTAITDNGNNWFFMQNNVMSYADWIKLVIGPSSVGAIKLNYYPTSMLTAIINPASPYAVGTATFTTGIKTITGAGGAAWTRDMIGGQIKCDADAVYYKIVDVSDGTHITLNTEYLETGGAGAAYTIDTFNLTATLDDTSASANDGTITFGANPLGVVTGIGALTSSTVITSTPTVAPDLVNVESNQGDLISTPYPNPTLATNLLTPWFTPWSQLTNIPLVAFFLILGTVILIIAVVWIMKKTNNQLIASFVLIAGEAMLWKLGIYELWPVIVTAIICFAIIVWERKPSI